MFITYADQVREAVAPPLQTLTTVLDKHPTDVVSGIHLLPFFPYSSNDGFAVIDYDSVDPALGSWDDITRLGGLFDAVAYLWKEIGTPCVHLPQTHAIIQLIRAIPDEVAP